MVNIGTRVAPVKIVFSKSKNATLIERKVLHYITLRTKYHHYTLGEIKTQVFTMSDVLACVSVHCAHQRKTQSRTFKQNLLIIRSKRVLT